jgi:hypothetical protein
MTARHWAGQEVDRALQSLSAGIAAYCPALHSGPASAAAGRAAAAPRGCCLAPYAAAGTSIPAPPPPPPPPAAAAAAAAPALLAAEQTPRPRPLPCQLQQAPAALGGSWARMVLVLLAGALAAQWRRGQPASPQPCWTSQPRQALPAHGPRLCWVCQGSQAAQPAKRTGRPA